MRGFQPEDAAASLEGSRQLLRAVDRLQLGDLDAATQFAEASAWQAQAYQQLGRLDDAAAAATEGRDVANRIVAQRPTHYLALRARALLTSALAGDAEQRMRHMQARTLYLDVDRDYRRLASMDPTNAITWNNMAVARFDAANALRNAGHLREAYETMRQVDDIEEFARNSRLPSNIMMYIQADAAFLAGQLADEAAARTHLAAMRRHALTFDRTLAPGSFDREAFAAEVANLEYGIGYALQDDATMRAAMVGQAERLTALKPASASQQRRLAALRARMHFLLARTAANRSDWGRVVEAARASLEHEKVVDGRTISDRQRIAIVATWLGIALASQGKLAEAREVMASPMAFFRETDARNEDDAELRFYMARGLYAMALADTPTARALLAEARAMFDALPEPMRRAWTFRVWGERIVAAQRG